MKEEIRKILSDKKLGENHPKYQGWFVTPWGQFPSATQAAAIISKSPDVMQYLKGKATKITARQIIQRCKNWEWNGMGYHFVDKELLK